MTNKELNEWAIRMDKKLSAIEALVALQRGHLEEVVAERDRYRDELTDAFHPEFGFVHMDMAELREQITAYKELCTAYRLGRSPKEWALKILERTQIDEPCKACGQHDRVMVNGECVDCRH